MHSIENVLLQMHNNLKLEDDVTYSSKDGWCILGYSEIVNNNVYIGPESSTQVFIEHDIWPSVTTLPTVLLKQGALVGRTTPGWGFSQ